MAPTMPARRNLASALIGAVIDPHLLKERIGGYVVFECDREIDESSGGHHADFLLPSRMLCRHGFWTNVRIIAQSVLSVKRNFCGAALPVLDEHDVSSVDA